MPKLSKWVRTHATRSARSSVCRPKLTYAWERSVTSSGADVVRKVAGKSRSGVSPIASRRKFEGRHRLSDPHCTRATHIRELLLARCTMSLHKTKSSGESHSSICSPNPCQPVKIFAKDSQLRSSWTVWMEKVIWCSCEQPRRNERVEDREPSSA